MIIFISAAIAAAAALNCNAAQTTYEIEQCAAIDSKEAEARMLSAYSEALSQIQSPEQTKEKDALGASQEAWIQYRKSYCEAVYQKFIDGTIRGSMFAGCMEQRARDRMFELQHYTDGQP
jgi:uncharacterized protein YecT (DUF1311 family)